MTARRTIVGAVLLFVAACTAVQAPITGRTQYMMVHEDEVVSTGASQYADEIRRYSNEGHLNADAAETARVRRIASRLIRQARTVRSESANWNWDVSVGNFTNINAHCYPGGKIVVYSGLIRTLNLTDDELAGVLAHEISHALAQHQREAISEKMTEQMILGILDVALTVASKGGRRYNPQVAASLSVQVASLMFTLPYSRERESEADRIGLTLMTRAGYDPHGLESAFSKMIGHTFSGPSFLSTHPANGERISAIEAAIRSDPELANRQYASAAFSTPVPVAASRFQVLKGNGPEDAKRYETLAKAGDANAELALGLMDLNGSGIPVDKEAAARLIESSANHGHPIGMNEIGRLYASGIGVDQDAAKAATWYQKAADAGIVAAKSNLGMAYFSGRGVPQDLTKAAALLEAPAAAGIPVAQRVLGYMYFEGKGVAKNTEKGWNLQERAAASKDVIAQGNLGFYLVKGQGVPKNMPAGLDYLNKAADNGYVTSMRILGDIYAKGDGVGVDAGKAVAYFERAAALNDAKALAALGSIYIGGQLIPDSPYGKLVPPDAPRAFGYYKRAADLGNETARFMVGMFYFKGLGVEKNDTLAAFNVRMSAERGYSQAQYTAGMAFARGVVVDKDDDEAVRWFKLAAAQGHVKAKEELKSRGLDASASQGAGVDSIHCKDQNGGDVYQPMAMGSSCPAGTTPVTVHCHGGDGQEFEALSGHCPDGTSKVGIPALSHP